MRAKAWSSLPAALAFALLAFQMAIPWTTRHFLPQDSPSHLYTGVVLKDLLLHGKGVYSSYYALQPGFTAKLVPNWATALLFGLADSIAGPAHAQALLASLYTLVGFLSFGYAVRSLSPNAGPWWPVANFTLHSWFLWIGFLNFYLGMLLCPLAAGFYIRHAHRFRLRHALALAAGLVGLFFTHILAAALAAMAAGVIAVWLHLVSPWLLPAGPRPKLRTLLRPLGRAAIVAAAMIPVLVLMGVFAGSSKDQPAFKPAAGVAWESFPMQSFVTGPGRSGTQEFLWPAMLCLFAVAALTLSREEWASARGGLFVAALLTMGLYLAVPDRGFGGDQSKVRFAWAVFLFGAMLASSAGRLRPLWPAVSLYVTCFLAGSLWTSLSATRAIGRAVDAYVSATDAIPAGATLIRFHYPTPRVPGRFGFEGIPFAPMFHVDSYAAARRRAVNLTDYQAASGVFPVVYGPAIDTVHRYAFWGLETPGMKGAEVFRWLQSTAPRFDYVVVTGQETTPPTSDIGALIAALEAGMKLVAKGGDDVFVRVYGRRELSGSHGWQTGRKGR